jgi:hypothetical protein
MSEIIWFVKKLAETVPAVAGWPMARHRTRHGRQSPRSRITSPAFSPTPRSATGGPEWPRRSGGPPATPSTSGRSRSRFARHDGASRRMSGRSRNHARAKTACFQQLGARVPLLVPSSLRCSASRPDTNSTSGSGTSRIAIGQHAEPPGTAGILVETCCTGGFAFPLGSPLVSACLPVWLLRRKRRV